MNVTHILGQQVAPHSRSASDADKLRLLGMPESFVRLLRLLAVNPGQSRSFRELAQALNVGNASLRRDLDRLEELGVIKRSADKKRATYALLKDSRIWSALVLLIGELTAPTYLLRQAVAGVAGVDAAFIFGSTAKGTDKPDSDIDLFVLSDQRKDKELYRNLAAVSHLTGKHISPVKYSKEGLARGLKKRFLREVLKGPKLWVAGTPKEILPIALAAGITEFAAVENSNHFPDP